MKYKPSSNQISDLSRTQKQEICPHLIFDESYHECGVANKKRTQWEAQGIIGRVAKGLKRFSNIPEEDLQRIAEELQSLVTNYGLTEQRWGVVCAYWYDIGYCGELDRREPTKEDVPKMCPKDYTFEQIEAMVRRLKEQKTREKENREKGR